MTRRSEFEAFAARSTKGETLDLVRDSQGLDGLIENIKAANAAATKVDTSAMTRRGVIEYWLSQDSTTQADVVALLKASKGSGISGFVNAVRAAVA